MSGEEIHRNFNDQVSRYLSGELTPEELAGFKEELRADRGKQQMLDEYLKHPEIEIFRKSALKDQSISL